MAQDMQYIKNNHLKTHNWRSGGEFKKDCLPWNTGKLVFIGSDNPNWKGGLPLCEICNKKIDRRSKRCKSCSRIGALNPFWSGGITPLNEKIRSIPEGIKWKLEVFKRDNNICQECGNKEKIEAHHIKPFIFLLRDFLKQYNQFSPIEDKDILARLSITYKPFWDIDNGKTLCEKCHKLMGKVKIYNGK